MILLGKVVREVTYKGITEDWLAWFLFLLLWCVVGVAGIVFNVFKWSYYWHCDCC